MLLIIINNVKIRGLFLFIQVQGCRIIGAIPQVQGVRADMTIESHNQHAKHTIGHSCFISSSLLKLKTLFFLMVPQSSCQLLHEIKLCHVLLLCCDPD